MSVTPEGDAETFARHRSLLFTVAYEMLGAVADAEDVVSETYLRWAERRSDEVVDHPRAYLVRIVTRLSLNRLRTLARRREDYVGPWLPEPVLTAPDVFDDLVLAESVSLALLVVLESLSPAERAVFVLREVFGFSYAEIAEAVGKSPAAVRQIAHRAHEHVQARRPRFEADHTTTAKVRERFLDAVLTGDIQALMDVLAPDVVLLSDGGGKVSAARRPINGADDVGRYLAGLASRGTQGFAFSQTTVNGMPAWALRDQHGHASIVQVTVADGQIQRVLFLANPDKLTGVEEPHPLTLR
jgi:RNA polymerase sigma-70 factor (ECF subfamily)